jgi:transposase
MLEHFTAAGLVRARAKQRTDSTHVLANVRVMNRAELVGETLRAALNEVATVAPDWLRNLAPREWYERYAHRVEEFRLPKSKAVREAHLLSIGQDGFTLLDAIAQDPRAIKLRELDKVVVLQLVWERHYEHDGVSVRWRDGPELSRAALAIESPYDPQARYSTKRGTAWTGYKVHVTESCDEDKPHLILNVLTTPATQQDVSTTLAIHQALKAKRRLPEKHLVDAGYIDADLLVQISKNYRVKLVGPPRAAKGWQSKEEDALTAYHFTIDWEHNRAFCPGGKTSSYWKPYRLNGRYSRDAIAVRFALADCRDCPLRARCTLG